MSIKADQMCCYVTIQPINIDELSKMSTGIDMDFGIDMDIKFYFHFGRGQICYGREVAIETIANKIDT